MPQVKARHILVDSADVSKQLLGQLRSGADFAQVAKEFSTCPTARQGGDLGQFGPGQMGDEIDAVVFEELQ